MNQPNVDEDDLILDAFEKQLFETSESCQKCLDSFNAFQEKCSTTKSTTTTAKSCQNTRYSDEYVKQLEEKLSNAEEKLRNETTKKKILKKEFSESQQTRLDELIVQCEQKMQNAEEEKTQILSHNARLKVEVHDLKRMLERAEELITTLATTAAPTAGLYPQQDQVSAERERIEMLEAQVQIYREDFESERGDRQLLQRKLTDLEEKLAITTKQLYEQDHQRFDDQSLDSSTWNRIGNYTRQPSGEGSIESGGRSHPPVTPPPHGHSVTTPHGQSLVTNLQPGQQEGGRQGSGNKNSNETNRGQSNDRIYTQVTNPTKDGRQIGFDY